MNIQNLLDGGDKFSAAYAEGVKKISAEFGQSKDALTQGLFDIVSAGTDTSQALEVLAASAQLANAGVTNTGVTSSAVLTAMKSYSDQVRDAADASDFLFSVQKFGRTTLTEVAAGFGQVAPLASLAGLSINDLGAALATATLGGSSTSEVITGLQALLNSFIQPTDDAKDAAAELGIELNSNALRGDNFLETLEAISGGSIEQQAAIAGSVRAFRALGPIIQDTGKFQEIYTGIVERQGVVQEAANRIDETAAIRRRKLGEQISNLSITFGQYITDNVLLLIDTTKDLTAEETLLGKALRVSGTAMKEHFTPFAVKATRAQNDLWAEIGATADVLKNDFDVQVRMLANETAPHYLQRLSEMVDEQVSMADTARALAFETRMMAGVQGTAADAIKLAFRAARDLGVETADLTRATDASFRRSVSRVTAVTDTAPSSRAFFSAALSSVKFLYASRTP